MKRSCDRTAITQELDNLAGEARSRHNSVFIRVVSLLFIHCNRRIARLTPLGVPFQSPSGVGLVLFGQEACANSFLDQPARVQFGTEVVDLPAHGLVWLK
jgi:hypothetical protein